MKTISLYIHEVQETPNRINSKIFTPKLSKTALNTAREKWFIIFKGYSVGLIAAFSSAKIEARGKR